MPAPKRVSGGNLLRQPRPGHAVVSPIEPPPRPVTLEGRHVRLEPLSLAHQDGLCAVGLDAELWRWAQTSLVTPADMRAYIETALMSAGVTRLVCAHRHSS